MNRSIEREQKKALVSICIRCDKETKYGAFGLCPKCFEEVYKAKRKKK